MTIDITDYVREWDHWHTSNSAFNLGPRAVAITWGNACKAGERWHKEWVPNDEARQEIRDYFRNYGAWPDEEIDGWSDQVLAAFLAQEISSKVQREDEEDFSFYVVNEPGGPRTFIDLTQ